MNEYCIKHNAVVNSLDLRNHGDGIFIGYLSHESNYRILWETWVSSISFQKIILGVKSNSLERDINFRKK